MIRINRDLKIPEIIKAIEVLKNEKQKSSGEYNQSEVLNALKITFNKKCYICENKNITSYNIEHLRPHKNVDKDLKFDLNNLFLACAHCNNIKSDKYENILDCTKFDVDELISFRKKGNFSWEEKIEIAPLKTSKEIEETIDLLNKVYNGTTNMKKLESCNIRKELRIEISKFTNILNEYFESEGEDKEDIKRYIKSELKANSKFTAFKRWIIRDNRQNLGEFLDGDSLKCAL